ncbi:putative Rhodanese-like domain, tRNA uridine(34) hydroxylase [Helianthus annuus]|nr:putative Rhodanese-like domain, tRNA uridine(34) hydroxylase [Helianthus annuus]KAJ0475103.1 putative Rhodanese-like domain, tRNA uridine(34) hydroxylase [Helianthus annuus]KAJ0650658.1 putative Rhodanese-like domain, tRNA uridine(34) hydroxylase [Helianthus annuus]KAJ0654412.1 putative Rhodanese-like domain, tRNA uridine(34) hydroxylase [Helianthus annuus]
MTEKPLINSDIPMQSLPFVTCYRTPPLLFHTLKMLSSSSPNPNPSSTSMNINPSSSSTRSTNLLPLFSNPHTPHITCKTLPQAVTVSNGFSSFSSCAAVNPVSVSGIDEDESVQLVVVSFYKFAEFPDHADLRKPLKDLCEKLYISGGIILAPEGINGSICGIRKSVEQVLDFIQSDDRLKGLRQIESPVSPEEEAIHHGHTSSSPLAAGEDAPFRWDHVRVKLKKEIVSLGMPSVSPNERVGTYVSPDEWNSLISDPDTVVIDVRNDYETRIGKFKGAVDPRTTAFREFPSWVDDQLSGKQNEGQKSPPRVAMYCTGGIRCEKASSFLLSKGFKEVYHLQGGILKYLEEVPKTESLWEGECFVFDKRVSVKHGLVPGNFKLCYGCKKPVSDADMESPEWEYGVTCPYCYASKSEEEKERARARQRQFEEWGVIGGPDKGRRPTKTRDANNTGGAQMSRSA